MTDEIDITGKIGELYPNTEPEWPMYSYSRAASILWNAIANGLCEQGWTEDQIKEWLQSKETRWSLDGSLGEAIEMIGRDYARKLGKIPPAQS